MTVFRKDVLITLCLVWLAAAVVWYAMIAPKLSQLPKDFNYAADIISFDNIYNNEDKAYIGKTQSNTYFKYSVEKIQSGIYTIRNSFDVKAQTGDQIIHVERLYGIDAVSGKHVTGFGDHDREGYLFAPKGLHKGEEFTYWHVNYDVPAVMRYQDTEEIHGLTTYHYRTTLQPDQTENLDPLPGVGETLGINLDVVIDVWIEPTTGWLVKYEDKGVGYYYDLQSQRRLYPWNSYSNAYTDESILEQVVHADQERSFSIITQRVIPLVFVCISALFLLALLLGSRNRVNTYFPYIFPLVILVAGVALSVFVFIYLHNYVRYKEFSNIQQDANAVTQTIQNRMVLYKSVSDGGQGLLVASDEVTNKEWDNYVEALLLPALYPGIHSLGYAPIIQHDDTVTVPIMYLEPKDERDIRSVGYDIYADPELQKYLEMARDTGSSLATGKIESIKDATADASAGFLLFTPYYGKHAVYTPEERQNSIQGYVFAEFQMSELIKNLFKNEHIPVAFEIIDDEIQNSDNSPMYSDARLEGIHISEADKIITRYVYIFGHRWKINFYKESSSQYISNPELAMPWLTAAAGLGISLTLSVLLYLAERKTIGLTKKIKHRKTA